MRFLAMLITLLSLGAAHAASAGVCVAEHGRVIQEQGAAEGLEAFRACALREYGVSAEPHLDACSSDLITLPVILLYRGDGLSRASALADLKKEGQLDDGSDYARRAPLMLDFAYRGAGPAAGKINEWIAQRVGEWTDRCLRGLGPKTNLKKVDGEKNV